MKLKKRVKGGSYQKGRIKNKKIKKVEQNEKVKNIDLGKPPNLQNITIKQTQYLGSQRGRHILLHLAGAKKSISNEDNRREIKEKQELLHFINKMKPFYDLLESIYQNYLEFPIKQKKKERLIVFFFRNNSDVDPNYDKLNPLENSKFQQNLDEIKLQLDKVFYRDLYNILKQLEGNEHNIQDQINLITQDIIEQTNQLNELSQANTIVKNLFIQLLIEQGNHKFSQLETLIEKQNKNQLILMFKQLITQNSIRITKFITDIVQLFQGDDLNNSIQCTFQQTNYDENYHIQQKWQSQENENSVYLSD
ncbi:unnamed protein product (macronuclear) [Paramecium tetraurelia]|uniref:Uncharacterized protein n=1 Tax=Paramecium tetraurelia TaxID=5888 RepID=A0CFA2_PARTE|nr:uncharacterized protein GSPATT00037908001 [Paramecium tetraurelia]CAK69469.1 unnamed protein product [Paramecium tetraurelia]|eukprot:XP_001436866.1 hypothetical protein (macronuclear) [Paramecium tetraurelia strain d4-2]